MAPPTLFIGVEAISSKWPLPSGLLPPSPPGLVLLVNRYDTSPPYNLVSLNVLVLGRDCELILNDNDSHSAHVALEHVSQLEYSPYTAKVLLSMNLRNQEH